MLNRLPVPLVAVSWVVDVTKLRDRFLVPIKWYERDRDGFAQTMIRIGCAMLSDFKTERFRPLMGSGNSYSLEPLSNDWWIHFRTSTDEEGIPEGFLQVRVHHRYNNLEGVDAVITLLIYRYGLDKYNPKEN